MVNRTESVGQPRLPSRDVDERKPQCANRIRPGTCGGCRWFKPPFHDRHWKGRLRHQTAGSCSVRDDEPRLRDQICDLHEDGSPIGSDPSDRMAALNQRMKRKNSAIKRRCIAGMKRVRQDAAYRAVQAAVMRSIMARPEMRDLARQHATTINRDPEVRKRQWQGRRGKYAPPHLPLQEEWAPS